MSLLLFAASSSKQANIRGDYVEARTCDVWTGPCFANSEINTTGEFAVMGWRVAKGSWDGEDLSGLGVAAAICAEGTLATEGEGKVRAVLYVDERANAAQEKALASMARALAGKYLETISSPRRVPISIDRNESNASLEIPRILKIATKALSCCDKHCGNEEAAYPPLAQTARSDCAKTIEHFFRGEGLGARWSDPDKRSAVVGTFVR